MLLCYCNICSYKTTEWLYTSLQIGSFYTSINVILPPDHPLGVSRIMVGNGDWGKKLVSESPDPCIYNIISKIKSQGVWKVVLTKNQCNMYNTWTIGIFMYLLEYDIRPQIMDQIIDFVLHYVPHSFDRICYHYASLINMYSYTDMYLLELCISFAQFFNAPEA